MPVLSVKYAVVDGDNRFSLSPLDASCVKPYTLITDGDILPDYSGIS
jgi:hypothetical protein